MKKGVGVFFLILLFGGGGVVFWKFYGPTFLEKEQRSTSDAVKESRVIRIGGDNYAGYFFVTSPEMRKQAARSGLRIDFTDDGAAYAERLAKFAKGEYDGIVLPINSYLQHGAAHKYPGVIVAGIAESKGADGIVGFGNVLTSGNINTDLNDPSLTFVFTPESASSFLLEQTIIHFDLFNLQGDDWKVEVGGSEEVLKRVKNREGDVFVLWEPDLSRALEIEGTRYIWGSDNFTGLIVDVMVFRREFVEKHRGDLIKFLQTYFRVMSIYASNQERLIDEMRKGTGLGKDDIRVILDKIDWYDLRENCGIQFGIARRPDEQVYEGVVDAIYACTDIMLRSGTLASDPIEGDAYLIIDSSLLEELAERAVTTGVKVAPQRRNFSTLSAVEWEGLREVGTMRVEPITYQFGKDILDAKGKEVVNRITAMLKNNYPNYWVAVRGHTGPGAEEAANRTLSLRRAQTVVQYLKAVHGIDENRLRAEGLGSAQPPQRKPGEGPRSYRYRLSRVEFVLLDRDL